MTLKTWTIFLLFLQISTFTIFAQTVYDVASYPDEAGFQLRIKNALPLLAERGFGKITKSKSVCPDTGLPVYTYAMEGEEIISPYTGRKYKQPATGYFSVRKRNEAGEITAFGGDPMKYDLPTATASILLGQKVKEAKAYLSIPANLSQQYHFACKNWVRFYALLADSMSYDWRKKFHLAVENYIDYRRISDDGSQWLKLSYPHHLVGQPKMLLGGNAVDGGTENHKIMWRTSGLLYAQLFPDTALISAFTTQEAELQTKEMLRDYLKRLLVMGNGEYDSEIYYPHSIEGFLNLYDFSPDPETRLLAKFALDYYFASYGLKTVDGMIAGAQKRGYLSKGIASEMEIMLWAFAGVGSRNFEKAEIPIHVATTTYRPNKVILNIIQKKLSLPFESKMSHPFYQMDKPLAFAESFYCSSTYALGNSQTSIVDNPNQQMVWSIVAKGERGPLCFSGGQPLRASTSGHSPYTQTLHSKTMMVVMTANTDFEHKVDTASPPTRKGIERANYWYLPFNEQPKAYEMSARQKYAWMSLDAIRFPSDESLDELLRFWKESKQSASTWFTYPNTIKAVFLNGRYYFETPTMWLSVLPFEGNKSTIIAPSSSLVSKLKDEKAKSLFSDYNVISFTGELSGYVVETAEKSKFNTLAAWDGFLRKSMKVEFSSKTKTVFVQTATGERLEMSYQSDKLRPKAQINGKKIDFDNYTHGAVYQSPYFSVMKGLMRVSDGVSAFTVDFKGQLPIYK